MKKQKLTEQQREEFLTSAEEALVKMALNNQYITSDTLIAVLEGNGYSIDNYSLLGGVFTRAAKAGVIDKSPSANQSKSHSAKTVWRSLLYDARRVHDSELKREKAGTKPQIDRVLALIERDGGATNWELSRVALKYTSVVSELRKDGYNIIAVRQKLMNGKASNTWLYLLVDEDDV